MLFRHLLKIAFVQTNIEMFYLNSTLNFRIQIVFVFQLEVYYKADRLLTGLTAQQQGTPYLLSYPHSRDFIASKN